MNSYLETALSAANAASAHILESLTKTFTISTKSNPRDIVTQVDIETETLIRSIIAKQYPEHSILGEEAGQTGSSDYRWIIDPIDGTNNFARRIPHFCVSIALELNNLEHTGVIVNPSLAETYQAQKDAASFKNNKAISVSDCENLETAFVTMSFSSQPKDVKFANPIWEDLLSKCHVARRMGSTALELAFVAEGRSDAFVGFGQNHWDYAAGILLVKEAGGVVDLEDNGKTLIAASSASLAAELKALI